MSRTVRWTIESLHISFSLTLLPTPMLFIAISFFLPSPPLLLLLLFLPLLLSLQLPHLLSIDIFTCLPVSLLLIFFVLLLRSSSQSNKSYSLHHSRLFLSFYRPTNRTKASHLNCQHIQICHVVVVPSYS